MAANKEKKNDDTVQENMFYEGLGINTCSIRNAKKVVKLCFECGDVPVLISEAGVGKSRTRIAMGHRTDFYVKKK